MILLPKNLDYKIIYSNRSIKYLKKLAKTDKKIVKGLVDVVQKISTNPHKCEDLKGKFDGAKKIREGKYRIVFDINDEYDEIIVLKIDLRSKIYKKN